MTKSCVSKKEDSHVDIIVKFLNFNNKKKALQTSW